VKTDWSLRAASYNNLEWTNKNDLLQTIVHLVGNVNHKTVLDVGIGTGKVTEALQNAYPNGSFYGIDVNENMCSHVRKDLNVKLTIGSVEDMSCFSDCFFDIAVARMVFHHVERTHKASKEIFRILKPAGKLIICEGVPPTQRCVDFYTEVFRHKEERKVLTHDDITQMFIKTKFKNITTQTCVLENISLNNWLQNGNTPIRDQEIIKHLHANAPQKIKSDYEMRSRGSDIFMTWKFVVVCGQKPG
jgi:ubiquinone/menaquinone biosynthesis C-methylase UbiE